jgi:hypothetical protein
MLILGAHLQAVSREDNNPVFGPMLMREAPRPDGPSYLNRFRKIQGRGIGTLDPRHDGTQAVVGRNKIRPRDDSLLVEFDKQIRRSPIAIVPSIDRADSFDPFCRGTFDHGDKEALAIDVPIAPSPIMQDFRPRSSTGLDRWWINKSPGAARSLNLLGNTHRNTEASDPNQQGYQARQGFENTAGAVWVVRKFAHVESWWLQIAESYLPCQAKETSEHFIGLVWVRFLVLRWPGW